MKEARISFMGDTQIGGDKEQSSRMERTRELVEQLDDNVEVAVHVGDLGTSSVAYDFLADYKGLEKSAVAKIEKGVGELSFEEQFQQALHIAFEAEAKRTGESSFKYVLAKTLRQVTEYPAVNAVLRDFAVRASANPMLAEKYGRFITNKDDEARLDMFKVISGKDEEFLESDKKAMIDEMHDALGLMSKLAGDKGKTIVVPGNQEIDNWQRVVQEILPTFQGEVDLQAEPSYYDVNDNVAIMGLPYEFDASQFDAKEFAEQARGKKAVILATHASPLLRGLADNVDLERYRPKDLDVYKAEAQKYLKVSEDILDKTFEEAKQHIPVVFSTAEIEEYAGNKISEIVDILAQKFYLRQVQSYDRMKEWVEARDMQTAVDGKAQRTPGAQPNPKARQFRELVKSLPDSVERIIVPWGHLHSKPEQALSNHPWFKYDAGEEIKPQKLTIGIPQTASAREIEFVYLPTAAIAIMDCNEDGSIDIKSLEKAVAEQE